MSYLLRIHVGPVQEFIATARRSSDLRFGSWLLSELSKAAALGIAETEANGAKALIFPAPDTLDALRSDEGAVINELVAVVEGEPRDVAKAARDKLNERLRKLVTETFTDEVRGHLVSWPDAEAQIMDLPEFYWVAVPLEGDYRHARALADHLLAARKNTRDFDPVTWGANRPKSSLDGARESVISSNTEDGDYMYSRFRARSGEHLSGVDLLKRLGAAGIHFPSTSHMAAMPLKKILEKAADNTDAAQAFSDYLDTLPPKVLEQEKIYHNLQLPLLRENGDLDGGVLFASRLTDHLKGDALRKAERALHKFYEVAGIEDDPNPYYAVLVGDGDFMGRTINALPDAPTNRDFSQTLAGFAKEAKRIIADHDGAAVFAGGDDVLALLPLHTAVACGAKLAGEFRERLKRFGADGQSPTFSAGIAIVHHLEPLEDALALARRAERTAKGIDEYKNALVVALDKRSGVPRLVVGHWGELDTRLHRLATYYRFGLIPGRLAYQLLDTYHRLGGNEKTAEGQSLRPILALEARRITERKQREGGQHTMDDSAKDLVLETVEAGTATIPAVADELVIAKLMADVATTAQLNYPVSAPEVPQS